MGGTMWRTIMPAIILAVGIAVALGLVMLRPSEARIPRVELVPVVDVAEVRLHTGPLEIQADGVVVPHREIQLAAQVDGTVVYKADLCRAGLYVPPRTLLLRIDPTDYQLQVNRLEQEVRQAQNALEQLDVEIANVKELLRVAQADFELEKRTFARQEELHRNRIISDETFEQAKRAVLKAENALVTLQNQLRSAQARRDGLQAALSRAQVQLAEAKTRLARTEIYSPSEVETVVIRETTEVGDYVRAGTVLVVLEDVSKTEVRVSLRRDQLSWIWAAAGSGKSQELSSDPGQAYRLPELPVTVVHEIDGAEFAWDGILWRYEHAGLNEATRTVPCRVLVPQARLSRPLRVPGGWRVPAGPPALLRGMFVSLRIHLPSTVPILAVPEEALQPGNWVWRFDPEGLSDQPASTAGTGTPPLAADPSREVSSPESQLHVEEKRRGRIFRVEVAPVASRRLISLVFAHEGQEHVIDGKELRFENGRLIRVRQPNNSPEVLYEGRITILTDRGPLALDGTQLQVRDGFFYLMTPEGPNLLPEPVLELPPGAPFGFRQVREILVPARPGYLEAHSYVVTTPLVANEGTVAEARSLP